MRALLEQYGQGFGYLATVRCDGGPRVHPVSPVIADGGLFCFVLASPKRRDLERDGRYALHAYPAENSDDEAYLAGRARPVTTRTSGTAWPDCTAPSPDVDWRLFELDIDVAMVTHREARPCSPREHRIWRARPDVTAAACTVRHGSGTVGAARGCSSMAEHQLPKLTVRVRFPSPAPLDLLTL